MKDAQTTSDRTRRRRFLLNSRSCRDENTLATESLARAETRAVKFLRTCMVICLLASAAAVSTGVYRLMRNEEKEHFHDNFQDDAIQLIKAFQEGLERNMRAVASMSTAITSYANYADWSFPFIEVPDFELRGANLRTQLGSGAVIYAPLVTDDIRPEWEDYALQHRDHVDKAYEKESLYQLDLYSEKEPTKEHSSRRGIEDNQESQVLGDGTGYHPKIFQDHGDITPGNGPYLPVWQRSPVEESRQGILNYDIGSLEMLMPDLDSFLQEKKAIFNAAIPLALEGQQWANVVLRESRFGPESGVYANSLHSHMVYPVFDSFDIDRSVSGVLVTDILWDLLFRDLLPQTSVGIICVISNSFGQTFSYRVDGPDVSFLGIGDFHDATYDDQEVSQDIIAYIQEHVESHNRADQTVGWSNTTQYTIRVFPSSDTEKRCLSSKPMTYALVLVAVFTFACAMLITYACLVEKRQVIMMKKVLENAKRAAEVERELNEFLAHEVRNPLAAAIAASTHLELQLNEERPLANQQREDIDVISASLNFINDFLRSMLDIYKANGNKIEVKKRPADLKKDIFDPIACILCKRNVGFHLLVECPENLHVLTDPIRLQQVVLNLVRNASEFVLKGFVRMRAEVVDHHVILYIEDSGPGVAPEKRGKLFSKYQQSLDLLCQGTGIGLNLSKKLMDIMGGDLYLDESYKSGVEGFPGARFVVQLNTSPLDIESALPLHDDSDHHTHTTADTTLSCDVSMVTARPEVTEHESTLPLQPDCSERLPEQLSCLFVDDDTMLRKLFMRAVKKVAPSWNVHDASCGEAALQLVGEHDFHLIFMDQYMASTEKRLLGSETVTAMRKKGVKSKICGLSANDVGGVFRQSGADSFLLKPMPCKPHELQKTLLNILNGDHSHSQEHHNVAVQHWADFQT